MSKKKENDKIIQGRKAALAENVRAQKADYVNKVNSNLSDLSVNMQRDPKTAEVSQEVQKLLLPNNQRQQEPEILVLDDEDSVPLTVEEQQLKRQMEQLKKAVDILGSLNKQPTPTKPDNNTGGSKKKKRKKRKDQMPPGHQGNVNGNIGGQQNSQLEPDIQVIDVHREAGGTFSNKKTIGKKRISKGGSNSNPINPALDYLYTDKSLKLLFTLFT